MISLDKHTTFEQVHLTKVLNCINEKDREKIVKDSTTYLPHDFYKNYNDFNEMFKELILADFTEIEKAIVHIESLKTNSTTYQDAVFRKNKKRRSMYDRIHKSYSNVIKSDINTTKLSVLLIKSLDVTVCPYCNRDYINSRGNKNSGAQMDHFFPRSLYPLFSVSLYNLVPVCGNCNRIKSDKIGKFKSPFDTNFKWNDEIKFTYENSSMKIEHDSNKVSNVAEMKIFEAYDIHSDYVKEIEQKSIEYCESQINEILDVLSKGNINNVDIKTLVFGKKIEEKDLKKTPLGKLTMDMHKQFKIYD